MSRCADVRRYGLTQVLTFVLPMASGQTPHGLAGRETKKSLRDMSSPLYGEIASMGDRHAQCLQFSVLTACKGCLYVRMICALFQCQEQECCGRLLGVSSPLLGRFRHLRSYRYPKQIRLSRCANGVVHDAVACPCRVVT